MTPQQSQLEVDVSIGNYKLVRLLGRGGMGDVWLASDLRADRLVALKFIKPHLLDAPEFRARFLNEARTLGRLEHDRIVTLYNVVEDGGHLALVLRFIEGTTAGKGVSLADYIDEHGALPITFVLSSAREILSALGFAHERGVIHRDMKPQNILLDKQTRSFLTDFGIAVVEFAERGTMTGSMIGTPDYMSPEQIQDSRKLTVQNKGHRSDIYSYGVVLYEMLAGSVPFARDTIYEIQRAHCVEPPPPLRELNPAVPEAVEALVMRCLEKNPDDRPQSCAELLEELTAAAGASVAVPVRAPSARAETVVEKRQAVDKPFVAKVAAAPAPSAAPSRGIPKVAWLGVGAVLIAAGVTYAVWSSKGTPPKEVIHGSISEPKKTEAAVAPPRERTIKEADNKRTGIVLPPGPRPEVVVPQPPVLSATAVRDYAQAVDLNQKQLPCEAVDAMNSAVKADPGNTKYRVFQSQLVNGCAVLNKANGDYDTANREFEQGNYCEGKNAIDEAVKSVPGNPKFLALQLRLKKAVNLNLCQ